MQRLAPSSSTDQRAPYAPASARVSAPGVLAIAAVHFGLFALLASFNVPPPAMPVRPIMVQMVSPGAVPVRAETPAPRPEPVAHKPVARERVAHRPLAQRPVAHEPIAQQTPRSELPIVAAQPAAASAATSATTDAAPMVQSAPAASAAAVTTTVQQVPAPPAPMALSAPRFDASYLQNPPPAYPEQSRRFGERGTVVLRVFVEPSGRPSRIEVKTGSGSPRLDLAAQDAVARWQFVAARLGDEKVGAWVLVPIVFNLKG